MGKYNFGSKELCKFLTNLKFIPNKVGGTSHQKYNLPKNMSYPSGLRPFVIVILGRKQYDPHTSSSYVRQLKNLGITDKELNDLV